VGESLRLPGRWFSHPKYGRQFEVCSYATVLPATEQGIRSYLGSGLIKGIGPAREDRVHETIGSAVDLPWDRGQSSIVFHPSW
jgi:exodeoxyribonuclease V alpha subunit